MTTVQLIVTFSEKRPKKGWFQVYVGEEEVAWEQWLVFLSFSLLGLALPD